MVLSEPVCEVETKLVSAPTPTAWALLRNSSGGGSHALPSFTPVTRKPMFNDGSAGLVLDSWTHVPNSDSERLCVVLLITPCAKTLLRNSDGDGSHLAFTLVPTVWTRLWGNSGGVLQTATLDAPLWLVGSC